MPSIRALIFDLDNTLLDYYTFKKSASAAAISAMAKQGLKVDKERAKRLIWNLYNELGFENRGVFQEFLKRVGHDPRDLKMVAAAVVAYREARVHTLKAYPGVHSTLKALMKRGYKLWLVTDAPGLKAWIRLASVGLLNAFERVITSDETGARKVTGKPQQFALNQLGLSPEEVLVVGDSGSRDVLPSKELGMLTAMALYGRVTPPLVEADYKLKSIKDLLKICK